MGNVITVKTDFYYDYDLGQVSAKIPGILAAMGTSEKHAAEMLEIFFEFLLKRWENNGVLKKMLLENQFEFENGEWKRTMKHARNSISINIVTMENK